ncbi:DUF4185 domain-containing protein [Rhodococcus sp. NPDC055112]
MTRTPKYLMLSLAATVASTAVLAIGAPAGAADLFCGGTGSGGSSGFGSTGGAGNPIPWLNGQDGRLPNLKGKTRAIEHVTGMNGPNDTARRFNVVGTDLGIMWDNGAGQVLTAFGDTTGLSQAPLCEGLVGDWRSNVLFRSSDRELGDGMSIDSSPLDRPNHSKEFLPSKKIPGIEHTVIPTTGISVNGVQYINYMSIRSWAAPGEWVTNYSQIATSTDNGETWTPRPESVRLNVLDDALSRANLPATGNQNFQMGAFVKHDGFIYNFGTPSGRSGQARLSRTPEASILNVAGYEYWDGARWVVGNPAVAVPVLDGRVSELSVQYNAYLGKFIALYSNESNGLVMRTAPVLTGPWSAPETLISGATVPGLYGAYMHPWSEGENLYFLATTWSDYNVMMMRTTLSR